MSIFSKLFGRKKDTDPLYQGDRRNQRQCQQLKKYLYQSHVFLLTRYVGRMDCGRFRTSAERPL